MKRPYVQAKGINRVQELKEVGWNYKSDTFSYKTRLSAKGQRVYYNVYQDVNERNVVVGMAVSGILMAICAKLAIGGIFWAAAACMFFSAYHFRIAEDKKEKEEEKKNEKETI